MKFITATLALAAVGATTANAEEFDFEALGQCFTKLASQENVGKIDCGDSGPQISGYQFDEKATICENVSASMENYAKVVEEAEKCFRSIRTVVNGIAECKDFAKFFDTPAFPPPETICAALDCEAECKTEAAAAVTAVQEKLDSAASATSVSAVAVAATVAAALAAPRM